MAKEKDTYAPTPLKWKFEAKNYVSSPILNNGILFFGSDDSNLYALDSKTGKEKWKFKVGEYIRVSSPMLSQGTLYFGDDYGNLYALDSKTGKEKWKFESGGGIFSSPIFSNGVIYFGSDDCHLYALDSETGEEKWKFETQGYINCSPNVLDDIIYFGSQDYYIYALDNKTGEEKWKFEAGYIERSSPVLARKTLYFTASDNFLYALDSETGEEKWKFETEDGIYSSTPVEEEGKIYFGSNDCHLYALDSETGEEKWKFETQGCIDTSPLISDGIIYFGSQDNHYYAVDTNIANELAPAKKAEELQNEQLEKQRNDEADKNGIVEEGIKIKYISGEITLEDAVRSQSQYNKEEKLKLKWKEEAKNNIIRVNCEKTASLENMLILKGCLVLILDPDKGWAYGNHIKSQGGGTFAENHIIMKYTLDDDGSPNWEIAVGLWFGHNCSQDELIETASELDGFDAIKAEAIFEVVYEIWSKYVEYGSDENPDYESTYLCQKSIIPKTKNDELWYAEDNFAKDNIMTTIDIESVSARVQGNMIFIS